jgi:hypothetical protein
VLNETPTNLPSHLHTTKDRRQGDNTYVLYSRGLGSNSTRKTAMLIIICDFPPSLLKNTDIEAEY